MGSYSGGSLDGFDFTSEFDNLPASNQTVDLSDGFYLDDPLLNFVSFDHSSAPPPEPYPQKENSNNNNAAAETASGDRLSSPSDDSEFSDSVLRYISQVLMEEDMEEKPCMFHDALALQAAEKSLYEALGEQYPSSMDHGASYPEKLKIALMVLFQVVVALVTTQAPPLPLIHTGALMSTSRSNSLTTGGGNSASFGSSMFKDSELAMQFKRGVDEASKFLPKSSQLFIDVESYIPKNSGLEENSFEVSVKTEKRDEAEHPPPPSNRLTGKKSHWRDEDEDLAEERSNKQSAVYVEETELSEMFDKILLCGGSGQPVCIVNQKFPTETTTTTQSNGGPKARGKKSTATSKSNDSKKETADLRTLLD
ncbi:hypothetical protein Bca52824_013388 [Brassica carinata]|uniref:Uncharacterized protein n=1 Tax=Brassica carinata TaxID=52824 RepID=A0A8X7W0R7_BRACI|nr:hypothetical protein Bca52824_013388 [Brassica carinata]